MSDKSIAKLVKAVVAVMKEVKGVEKNTQVGTGNHSYKGVSDKDVKQVVQDAMAKHGLCILPIHIEPNTKIKRWQEENSYQGNVRIKMKQSVFTEIKTTYLLVHDSGESIELQGIGHANDPSDKAAGKATTYALKNTLLYTFLIPTGAIDDTDKTHSDEHEVAPKQQKKQQPAQQQKQKPAAQQPSGEQLPTLVKDSEQWNKIEAFNESGKLTSLAQITKQFTVNPVLQAEIVKMIKDRETAEKNKSSKPNLTKEIYDKAMRMRSVDKVQEILDGHEMQEDARKGLESKIEQLKKPKN